MTSSLGVIGAGKMGGALALAVVRSGQVAPAQLFVHDKDSQLAGEIARQSGGSVAASVAALCARADTVIVAVKPQDMPAVLAEMRAIPPRVVVSVAAGLRIAALREGLGPGPAVIRTMPNRPALVGAGVTALMAEPGTAAEIVDEVEALLRAAGTTVRLDDEAHFDAVTALSGSGPAFVFHLVEGLVEGGVRAGLPATVALELAVATANGAGRLLAELGGSPAAEREAVTSRGGTTEAGLRVLGEAGFSETVARAVEAAARRSRELGQPR